MPCVEPPPGLRENVPLAQLTTLGVGGQARWFVQATSISHVAATAAWCRERGVPLSIIGGGSNVVVSDAGLGGAVLHVAIRGVQTRRRGEVTTLRLGAGEPWDDAVAASVSLGLSGLECLSGIPGSVGGTPIQNVGAYGQDVSSSISGVTVLDRQSGEVGSLTAQDCRFGYRTSRFKGEESGRFVVCEVTYDLHDGPPTVTYPDIVERLALLGPDRPTVAAVRDVVLSVRRDKGMVLDASDSDTRSVGSFFVNPVVASRHYAELESVEGALPGFMLADEHVKVPAAWLIERAGFSKGYRAGRVGLSSKHALAIVNRGGASAHEVVTLARRIKEAVADRFNIWLRPEPTFVGFGDSQDVSYLLCEQAAEVAEP